MEEGKTVLQLIQEYENLAAEYTCSLSPEKMEERDVLIRNCDVYVRSEQNSYCFFDLHENSVVSYFSYGDDGQHLNNLNHPNIRHPRELIKYTDPAYRLFIITLETEAFRFLISLSPAKVSKFRLLYMRQILDKHGKPVRFLHKVTVALTDNDRRPWILLIASRRIYAETSPRPEFLNNYFIYPCNSSDKNQFTYPGLFNLLTRREQEIAKELSIKLDKKRIADKLNISQKTIKTHCSNIMKKLHVDSIMLVAGIVKQTGCKEEMPG